MCRILLGFSLLAAAAIAAEEPTHEELLERIRSQMRDTLSRLPNYTCRETIERKVRQPPASQFEIADLVRLEISFVGGRELFAWPGSARFEEKDIMQFVPTGSIGTGNFGGFAKQVFASTVPIFTWTGQYNRGGRTQVEFAFRVGPEASEFRLSHDGVQGIVGFRGSFTADAATHDVIDLEVEAQNIPARLELFEARERVEYARTRISDSDYLLAKASETAVVDASGMASTNRVVFDACHEFRGESTISFADPESDKAVSAAATGPKTLPSGIKLHMRTDMPIERGVTAIGDTVSAVVDERIAKPAIPAGAKASLRIVRMQPVQIGTQPGYLVGFELLSVEAGGQKYEARGSLEGAKGPATAKWDRKGRVAFIGSKPVSAGLRLTWLTTGSQ